MVQVHGVMITWVLRTSCLVYRILAVFHTLAIPSDSPGLGMGVPQAKGALNRRILALQPKLQALSSWTPNP